MLVKEFNQQNLSEAEKALIEWGVKYTKLPGGDIIVDGDINIESFGIKELPDLTRVEVKGNFICAGNQLTSLKGAPQKVHGYFNCSHNALATLEGAPQFLRKGFWCIGNQLTSLKGAPQEVGEDFGCYDNRLITLEGGPLRVRGSYYCYRSNLKTLQGAPLEVGGSFCCQDNDLINLKGAPKKVGDTLYCVSNDNLDCLEGAPKSFKLLKSDFGSFKSYEAIPEEILYSLAARAEMNAKAAREFKAMCKKSVTLQKPLRIKKIRFDLGADR